ncbi:MAG: hypothetical protein K0S65_767, partial [Labilithrix sp.]|nr:hypothetical protein [Labilithrix sp.]
MPRSPSGTLVVAAWEPELERFRALVTPARDQGHEATDVFPVGIGLVDATVGTASRLARGTPDLVLFVGTCGA